MAVLVLPVLQGERLALRPLTEAHLDRLVEVMWDPSVLRWWGTVASPAFGLTSVPRMPCRSSSKRVRRVS